MATAAELRALVRGRAAISANDQGLTDTVLNGFVNSAARTVGLEGDWPWNTATETISTVASTGTYAPPALWLGTKSLHLANTGQELVGVQIDELDQYPSNTRGRPKQYAVWDEVLVLRPVPDTVYTLTHRYYSTEGSVLTGSDPLDAPEAFLEGAIEYATYLSLRHVRRLEEAREALNAYTSWVKRAKDNRIRRRGTGKVRVRPGSLI